MDREEMYKRQLDGTNAALNCSKQRIVDLESENEDLKSLIDDLLGFIYKGSLNSSKADEFEHEIEPKLEKYGFL